MNIFDLLHTNEGFLALQAWFVKSLIICENNLDTLSHGTYSNTVQMTPKNVRSSVMEVDEHGLAYILKCVLLRFDEILLYEIFDSFKEHGDCYSSINSYQESRTLMS